MALASDLLAFVDEHRRCGWLDGVVEGAWVCMRCKCGAVLARLADDD